MTESGTSKEHSLERSQTINAGAFVISNLSPSPDGFEIVNMISKRRRDQGSPFPLSSEEAVTLKNRMQGEVAFASKEAGKTAQKQGRERTTKDYVQALSPLVGVRNIHQNGNQISFDTRPVSFPVYSDLVRRETENQDLLDLGEATGTAAAILTKDGKLLVQYRSGKNNRAYKNIPGASSAGLFKGQFNHQEPGTLMPITAQSITENLLKEIEEELQTDRSHVKTKTVAVAHDQIKPHYEFLIMAELDKTSDELEEKGLITDEEEGHDSKERFFAIDGTPQAIEKLLVDVKCPLPTTHSAAFFLAGYNLILGNGGKKEADLWAERVGEAVKNNYESIDKIVRGKYSNFPEKLGDLPKRSALGYDPQYSPEEQGLPSLIDELKRTELITGNMYEKLKLKWLSLPQN